MRLTLPIFVEHRRGSAGAESLHNVRPLFFPQPQRSSDSLSEAMSKLTQVLTLELNRYGEEARHELLAQYSFSPEVRPHRLDLALELRRTIVRGRFFCISFRALGRQVAFFPTLPDVWFDLKRGESIEGRAREALTRYFRRQEKEQGEDFAMPERVLLDGTAWVTPLELDVSTVQRIAAPPSAQMAFLGGPAIMNGQYELQRVGRCLNFQYPTELDRTLHRDAEVAELDRLLKADDRRPVVLLGPRLVGKTAVLHEHVFRVTSARTHPYMMRENVWLLSPQRLVSGMSFVGQWERRLLAILKHAKSKEHLLYFDDFLGLYQAGISRDSNLSMAQVLKPYLERRDVRILAEMTPEAFRIFRELDRGLADQFHLLPLREPNEQENRQIQFGVIRRLELKHGCHFALDALPTVIDLQRRYVRDGAFPGKAARFLQQLALTSRRNQVTREKVLDEFRQQSGLALTFLDPSRKLERAEIVQALRSQVIGQAEPLEAVADILCIAKARLNDPGRPLASLLFLGPTGVGKTQCAKALARYLFGDADRLVRFDMNEFVMPGAAARLIGTFDQPDGLLTSAIRRRPFAVVLFDEIEKAYPDVFDLLLQVLGEGRLTDARGRTVDFSNTIIILTSNLGTKAATARVGFGGAAAASEARTYIKAAEGFFRPEFFNRLDRVVPFANLSQADIRQIARLVIQDVFAREGLARRRCLLQIDERTLDTVAEQGFSPQLGARALKRGIERQLTQPVAAQLARLRPDAVTVVQLYGSARGLEVDLQPLVDASPVAASLALLDLRDPLAVYQRVQTALQRIEADIAPLRPAGTFSREDIEPAHYCYFMIREQIEKLRLMGRKLEDRLRRGRGNHYVGARPASLRQSGMLTQIQNFAPRRNIASALAAQQDLHEHLNEMSAMAKPLADQNDPDLLEILRETALLQALLVPVPEEIDQALIHITPSAAGAERWLNELILKYTDLARGLGLESALATGSTTAEPCLGVIWKGPHAVTLAMAEVGTHLLIDASQQLIPHRLGVIPLYDDDDPVERYQQFLDSNRTWRERRRSGAVPLTEADPSAYGPVLRIYEAPQRVLDLRTGLLAPQSGTPEQLRTFLLHALPLPKEVAGV